MIKKLLMTSGIILSVTCSQLLGIEGKQSSSKVESYQDFNTLIKNHEFNHYPNFDGITCAVIVINSLNSNSNEPTKLGNKTLITQENIFDNQKVSGIVTPESVEKNGVALEQLTQLLQIYGLKAQAHYPHIMTEDALISVIVDTLNDPNTMMIVYFDESQSSSNNKISYSLVAGYSAESDSVLILNVSQDSKNKQWVKTKNLLKGMQALDEHHTPRGFILVEKPLED